MLKPVHFLQIIDKRPQSNFRLKCIESVKRWVRDDDIYEVVEVDYSDNIVEFIRTVDKIKLSKASQIANLFYIDTDVFLSKPPYDMCFDENIPYFGKYDYNPQRITADIFMFFVNNRIDYFQNFLSIDKLNAVGYGINLEALRALRDFNYFDDMDYIHSYATLDKIVYMQRLQDISRVLDRTALLEKSLRNQITQLTITLETFDTK